MHCKVAYKVAYSKAVLFAAIWAPKWEKMAFKLLPRAAFWSKPLAGGMSTRGTGSCWAASKINKFKVQQEIIIWHPNPKPYIFFAVRLILWIFCRYLATAAAANRPAQSTFCLDRDGEPSLLKSVYYIITHAKIKIHRRYLHAHISIQTA